MSVWQWLVIALDAVALVWLGLQLALWRAERKRNEAGIPTSGRGLMIGSLMGKRFVRRVWLRVRMIFATRARKKQLAEQAGVATAQEAAALLGNMKGVFMKVGQIISFANDALPDSAKGAMQGLQKDAPPMAFPLVRGVIEAELGGDLGKRFKHVDETPLAAASIGQVHRAKLRDGTDVVVKVQYPGVDSAIENDLATLDKMGVVIGAATPALDAKALLAELRTRIVDELDYRIEGRNQEMFRHVWAGHPMIRVPRVHREHTTKRVLTSELVKGFGFYDFVKEANAREKQLASATIADFVFDSMFCHLAYNGDPHPGNYLFHEDGAVTFIDFGCVKRFTPAKMADLKQFFISIVEQNRERHDSFVQKLELVRPGREWDRDQMWTAWRYHLEPYWAEDFVFDESYLARGREVMAPKNTRDMNLPPDLLFFTRITFGLNAISQQLGSRGNFHRSARRYFYGDQEAPTALGLLGLDVPDDFRRLPTLHEPGAVVARVEASGELPTWSAVS